MVTVVKNDYFKFEGKIIDSCIFAKILLDEVITNTPAIYSTFTFIVSGGKTSISFNAIYIKGEDARYQFTNLEVTEGLPAI
ncbi:hypothetical protein, partial [Klebsiella pneumoniae]|uniref:hypothetical protein n=1 Tax=Klebsiella pneumoniae TaxID=573 RepID=UPI003CE88B05